MANKLKTYFQNYFKKKSKFSIATDIAFFVLLILLIIPSTRVEVSSFFIRLVSLPPSEIDADEQYFISENDKQWALYTMEGKTITLAELMTDKPVFINFWATWCPPCVAEMPGIRDLHKKYGDQVSFILASNEPPGVVFPFAEKRDFVNLPFYQYRSVPAVFRSESIPATFVLSKDGRVVLSKKGAARWNSGRMNEIIDQLLAE